MFAQAAELALSELKAYRAFVSFFFPEPLQPFIGLQTFTDALSNPLHDPFFSAENAPLWITSLGF
jgi:hypothetical protein